MSKQFIINNIAKDLELNDLPVKNTVELFEDGATVQRFYLNICPVAGVY